LERYNVLNFRLSTEFNGLPEIESSYFCERVKYSRYKTKYHLELFQVVLTTIP